MGDPSPFAPHGSTPSDLKARLAAERAEEPFLVFRDADDVQQILPLTPGVPVRIGRDAQCELLLAGDGKVSRLHAELEGVGDVWSVFDHGMSRNGSFVNEQRVDGRRVLRDGDVLRVGDTHLLFRAPGQRTAAATVAATTDGSQIALSDTQRRVLVALCRPLDEGAAFATPASNKAIADEVFLSVDRVKAHLGALFDALGVADLEQNAKRAALAERALRMGLVTRADL